MGLQINLGLHQQLIVLIMSLPLGLHPSPLGPSSFSTRGLCPSPLRHSSFSTWAFSLLFGQFQDSHHSLLLGKHLPSNVQDHHRVQVPLPSFSCWLALLCNLHLHLVTQSFHILNFGMCILIMSLLGIAFVSWPVRQ